MASRDNRWAPWPQRRNNKIDLYFWPTPSGKKITIQHEEASIPYNIKPIIIGRGDQLTPDFLKISPNGRMPAIVDHKPRGGGPVATENLVRDGVR